MLDPIYRKNIPFTTLFDKLSIDVNRRGGHVETFNFPNVNNNSDNASNTTNTNTNTTNAYAYSTKIISDNPKGINIRIQFERNVDETTNSDIRYELSDLFLLIFPHILVLQNKSVTEQELLFTLWVYVTEHGLVDADRKCIRCDKVYCILYYIV